MTLKWTCDSQGNWRQVMVVLSRVDGKLVESKPLELGGPTAPWGKAA